MAELTKMWKVKGVPLQSPKGQCLGVPSTQVEVIPGTDGKAEKN